MIRLLPSQVALTESDVAEFKRRSEEKLVVRLMAKQSHFSGTAWYDSSDCDTLPRVQQGAQRSRDDALVHPCVSYMPSSASSERDDLSDVCDDYHAGVDGQWSDSPTYAPKDDTDGERSWVKRDSVLSHEEIMPQPEQNITRRLTSVFGAADEIPPPLPPRRSSEGTASSQMLEGSYWPNRVDTKLGHIDAPKSSLSSIASTREGGGVALQRSPAHRRRYRPRSFSDPCDTPLQSLELARARRSPNSVRTTEKHLLTGITRLEETIPERPSEVDAQQEDDDLSNRATASSSDSLERIPGRRGATPYGESDARHRSLPVPPATELTSPVDGNLRSCGTTESTAKRLSGLGRVSSAMDEVLQHRGSPLDTLSEHATAYSTASWIATLPTRSRTLSTMLMPTFDSLDTSSVKDLDITHDRGAARQTAVSSRERSATLDLSPRGPSTSSPTSRSSAHGSEVDAVHETRRRPVTWGLGANPAPGLVLGGGGRPSFGSIPQGPRERRIRRRPVPNAEQENREDMERFEAEREIYRARTNGTQGGILDNTPPPTGRLEGLLR